MRTKLADSSWRFSVPRGVSNWVPGCRIFELDEDKRITMQEIKSHDWFTTPLTEEHRAAMNDILSEQMRLDYLARRHGVRGHSCMCCLTTLLRSDRCTTLLYITWYIVCLVSYYVDLHNLEHDWAPRGTESERGDQQHMCIGLLR